MAIEITQPSIHKPVDPSLSLKGMPCNSVLKRIPAPCPEATCICNECLFCDSDR